MIYKLIVVSLLFCAISYAVKASTNEIPGRTKKIDTLLVNSRQSAMNVEASNSITPAPVARKIPVSTKSHNNLNCHKNYHTKIRREKIEVVAAKVRKIQAKVDKIEARIKEIELQDQ